MIDLKYYMTIFYIFLSIIILTPSNGRGAVGNTFFKSHLYSFINDTADTLSWPRPRFSERAEERHKLAEGLGERINSKQVIKAMRHVPRHRFVPEPYRHLAYENRPLPIGHNQTISQPFIVAYMTQLLNLKAGDKVLEIGTGSGYQAAVLAEITPHVYTMEIVHTLAKQVKKRFFSLGYSTIKMKNGNGYAGWKQHAPFDAIILTAAPEAIPEPLINQLNPGGILVAPVGPTGRTQSLKRLRKSRDGSINIEQVLPVRFVPMTGNDQQQ